MKRKLLTLCLSLLVVCTVAITLTACSNGNDDNTPPPTSDIAITGITFESDTFVYDGQEKEIIVSGTIPNGVSVSYTSNKGTNAGTYNAVATLTGNGYIPLTLNATLKIDKANITSVSVQENQSATYDTEYHFPTITGTVPNGVSTQYYIDDTLSALGARNVGTYNFKVVLSGNNYNTLTLECVYKINLNLSTLTNSVFESFGSVPDVWTFLPTSFKPQNRTISSIPDYSNFVNVSSIATNGIGKQLNVAYGLLNKTTKAITYIQPIYSALNTIKNLYTNFIDSNPEEYKSFSGSVSGFTFTLALTETQYKISANIGSVSVVVFANTADNSYGARVQLTNTTVLKYTVSENHLLIAMDILDTVATQIEFVRENGKIVGYMYEYLTVANKQIMATSTMITVDQNYTTLIGTKGDFIPTADSRNCEVYLNSTGELVGTEVRELLNVKGLGDALYNTLWYTINDVSGITSIKKEDKANGLNADTIYINNATEAIHSKTVSILPTSKKAYSRRFDIEFKKMYFYQFNAQNEEYEEVSCEIPMIFVQEEMLSDFVNDFSDENANYLTGKISLNVSASDKSAVNYGYYTLLQTYDLIKDSVTFESITNYCKQ